MVFVAESNLNNFLFGDTYIAVSCDSTGMR